MLAIIEAAGWPIWLLIAASVGAVTIIVYRLLWGRESQVAPKDLLARTVAEYRRGGATPDLIQRLSQGPLLGRVFAAGLKHVGSPREVMKESIEDAGREVARELDQFLTTLGSIASMSPLLGLFGTVVGMIEIFGSQTGGGSSPAMLAHGISVALYNTAYGLIVAIPSMIFYRHFRAKADALLLEMELQAIKLVEIIHGERRGE